FGMVAGRADLALRTLQYTCQCSADDAVEIAGRLLDRVLLHLELHLAPQVDERLKQDRPTDVVEEPAEEGLLDVPPARARDLLGERRGRERVAEERPHPQVEAGHLEDLGLARDEERSEEHTSELQSRENLVCRLL